MVAKKRVFKTVTLVWSITNKDTNRELFRTTFAVEEDKEEAMQAFIAFHTSPPDIQVKQTDNNPEPCTMQKYSAMISLWFGYMFFSIDFYATNEQAKMLSEAINACMFIDRKFIAALVQGPPDETIEQ